MTAKKTPEAKTPEQTPKTPEAAKQPESSPKPEEAPKSPAQSRTPRAVASDPVKYDRYANLKLLDLSGTKLSDELKKEMESLEAELKKNTSPKPIRTVTAAIGNEKIVLIEAKR